MPTAPNASVNLLIVKQRHLKHKIENRPVETYFTAPLADIRALERINDRLRFHGVEPQETPTNHV